MTSLKFGKFLSSLPPLSHGLCTFVTKRVPHTLCCVTSFMDVPLQALTILLFENETEISQQKSHLRFVGGCLRGWLPCWVVFGGGIHDEFWSSLFGNAIASCYDRVISQPANHTAKQPGPVTSLILKQSTFSITFRSLSHSLIMCKKGSCLESSKQGTEVTRSKETAGPLQTAWMLRREGFTRTWSPP